jgi:predicted porin
MQYKRLAAALVATFPLFASAQSSNVQMYGKMDAAISSEDNGVTRHTVINSGNESSSRIGFKGTEDLGNGLKAVFNIEAGISIDTGAADSNLFQRRAVVGLQGDFGTVTVGREYSPIAAVAGASDISGQGFYGSNLSAFNSGRLTRRLANSVNYKSTSFSGFDILAAYSAGEQAANAPASKDLKGVGVEYNDGPLYLGAAFHSVKNQPSGDDKEYAFGAAYKYDIVELKGNWMVADPQGANNKFTQWNLGFDVPMGPGKFFVNLQQNKIDNGAKGNGWAIDYDYALSKRTDVYTGYAAMRNNGVASFQLNSSATRLDAGAAGADPKVFNVGIRHTF